MDDTKGLHDSRFFLVVYFVISVQLQGKARAHETVEQAVGIFLGSADFLDIVKLVTEDNYI